MTDERKTDPEKLAKVVSQVHNLLDLAADEQAASEERRTAAGRAAVLIRRYDLAVVPYEDVVYPERAREQARSQSSDGDPSIVERAVRAVGRELGGALSRGVEVAAVEVAKTVIKRGRR